MKLLKMIRRKLKKPEGRVAEARPMAAIGRFRLRCNLCHRSFRATSRQLRFCRKCRAEDELFRFADWLPGR